jgi:hypothetical protein
MRRVLKAAIFLFFLNILFSVSAFAQGMNHNAKEIFVREGFGFIYAEDEMTSLSLFYKNHGQPIKTGENISVNRMDGVMDKIIYLEFETFHAKFIQYGDRTNYNGPKEKLMNISSKKGIEYLYGIKDGMEIDKLYGILGHEEMALGKTLWFINRQRNIAIIYMDDENKVDGIVWTYEFPDIN